MMENNFVINVPEYQFVNSTSSKKRSHDRLLIKPIIVLNSQYYP
jgi:hypothetical protein